jgi:outer membrane lipoprotein-sorting protein
MLSRLSFVVVLLAAVALVAAQPLDEVLAKMDTAAAAFRVVSAKVQKLTHTAVINDTSEESGEVIMFRPKPRETRMLIHFGPPDTRSIAFHDRTVEIYYPKIKTVQEYDLSKQRELVDQFLLLGFGTPGKDLKKDFNIRVLGEENVSGQQTDRLELVPKSKKAREQLEKVELWISQSGGYPVRQKFYQPSGDYTTITYTDIKINPNVSEDAVKLNLPAGVKREYPQR